MVGFLFLALMGGVLGAALGGAVAIYRKDLALAPLGFALSAGLVSLAASIFSTGAEAMVLFAALSVLALTDVKLRILPNELTYGLIIAGLTFALIGPRDPVPALIGASTGAAALWSLRAIWLWARGQEALGLGDVKMLAGIGAFAGPYALPEIVFWAAMAGIGIAALMILKGERDPEIPFGAALALSAWLYITCGPILFAL